MPECHVLILMNLIIVKPFSFKLCCSVSIFLGICAIFLHKKCLVLRKSACPFGQVKTKMYLPGSPFFKNSPAGVRGLVLMSNPDKGLEDYQCYGSCKTSVNTHSLYKCWLIINAMASVRLGLINPSMILPWFSCWLLCHLIVTDRFSMP